MTYEEGMDWLSSMGGGLKRQTRDEVVSVMAFAHNLAATVLPKNYSDASDVRQCEIKAIEELKDLIDP